MQRALPHPVSVLGRQAEDIGGANPFDFLKSVRERLDEFNGVGVEDSLGVIGPDEIASVDIKTLSYPGFPTDQQAQFMVLMSLAKGLSLIAETIFENRFIHVSELKRMGADIRVSGNAAMVKGVPVLSGAPLMASDLRASASLVLAGLAAQGETEVNRVYHLDRGYECLERKLSDLGAVISRMPV